MESTPLQVTSNTNLLYKAYDPFSTYGQSNYSYLILYRQFGCRTSLCFTDQVTQEENLQGGTSSLVGQFLHPISLVRSSRSIQCMQIVRIVPKQNFHLCRQFGCGPAYASQIKTQEEHLQGGTSSVVDQFLHPSISSTELKIH